jgi:catechol 2,3-dioxygenase-like lactoylglutathione lyase family enzyme
MGHVSVVVDDLTASIAFFELGLEVEDEATVEGRWVDRGGAGRRKGAHARIGRPRRAQRALDSVPRVTTIRLDDVRARRGPEPATGLEILTRDLVPE